MASEELVRVTTNPEQGSGVKLSRKDAEAYVASHPGSFIVAPSGEPGATAAEQSATRAQDSDEGEGDDFQKRTIAELRDHAEANEVDLTGARTKAEILERLTAADEQPEGDASVEDRAEA